MEKGYKINKIIYMLAILIIPVFVNAASVNVSTSSLNIKQGESGSFTISCTNCEGSVTVTSNNNSVASVTSIGASGWIDSAGIRVTVAGNSAGTAIITVKTASVSDNDYNMVDATRTITVNVTAPSVTPTPTPSTRNDNVINSLNITNCSINFNSGTRSYTCNTDADSINITGSATGGITGGGRKSLNYGSNSFTVRAANSNITYSITVIRNDNRSNDASLASLEVVGQTINFDPDIVSYDLTVNNTIEVVTINATATHPNATVTSGIGEHLLEIGRNEIPVIVTAENGETRTYYIVIERSEKANIPSTSLNRLVYKTSDYEEATENVLPVANGKKVFKIGVNSSTTKLYLEYETSSKTTTYNVVGNENLKEGMNKITIEVKDTDCDTQIYTIYVYRQPLAAKEVTSLTELEEIDSDIIYNSNSNDDAIIPASAIKQLKNSNKKLIFNIVNDQFGVDYSFEFNSDSDLNDTLELEFIRTNTKPLTFSSNIPSGVSITAYIEELFEDGTLLKLYTYDQKNNKYVLISDSVKVEDGYVTFTSDGSSNYILTTDELKVKTTGKEWAIRIICILVGAIIATGINFAIKQVMLRKNPEMFASLTKNKKDEKEVPVESIDKSNEEKIKVNEHVTPTYEIKEEPVMEEPIKPLTYEDLHEKINPTKKVEPVTTNIEDSIFPEINQTNEFTEGKKEEVSEPEFEIKFEEEEPVTKEPRRNIFGEIIDENKDEDKPLPKSLRSKYEEETPISLDEIKPFSEEPVGDYSTHQGIEEIDDNSDKDNNNFEISFDDDDNNDSNNFEISFDDDNKDDNEFKLNFDDDNEIGEIAKIKEEMPSKENKKHLFDDDDDDTVTFPKF